MRIAPLLLAASSAALLGGCAASEPGPPAEPDHPEIGDPAIDRPVCPPPPEVTTFGPLMPLSRGDELFGPCGEVAWFPHDDSSTLHILGSDGEQRTIAKSGEIRPHFFDGTRILYDANNYLALESAGEEQWGHLIGDLYGAGALPGSDDLFWACTNGRILRLDEGREHDLATDFHTGTSEAETCEGLHAGGQEQIAYITSEGKLAVVDARGGSKTYLEHPARYEKQEGGWSAADVVRLSPDGSYVLHEPRMREVPDPPQGLNPASYGLGTVAFVPLDGGASVTLPGTLEGGEHQEGSLLDGYEPWMARGPGVFLPDLEDGGHLLGFGAPRYLEDTRPLAIRGNHLFVETKGAASLIDLGDGSIVELFEAQSLDHVVPYRWGGPVAFSHRIDPCGSYEEEVEELAPHGLPCDQEIWGLTVWDSDRWTRRLASGFSPFEVRAIGPDGSMIVFGFFPELEFRDEGPNDGGGAGVVFVGPRYALLDSSGKAVREIDGGRTIYEGLGGEHFALLRRLQPEGEELVAIDWATGEEQILATGRYIERFHLDASGRRVTALIWDDEVTASTWRIYAGVVR